MRRGGWILLLIILCVTACDVVLPERPEALPTSAPPPPPLTITATRPAFPTVGITTPSPSANASATPNPSVVSETFQSPTGVLSFRYPTGWTIDDRSDAAELLVTAQSPANAAVGGLFVANVLNVDGQLRMEDLQTVADDYLQNLFGDEVASNPPTYRQEGEFLIATIVRTSSTPAQQFELRFTSRNPYYLVLVLIAEQDEWNQSAPVLDEMARSVVVAGVEAGATPLPTATSSNGRLTEGLALENETLYTASTGSVYLVGEVSNTSGQPYEGVRADVELLDDAGTVVARQTWNVERRLLPSGESSPFVAILTPGPTNATDYRVTLSALPATFYTDRLTTQFETRGVVGSQPAFADYALRGQVANLGPAAEEIIVMGAVYNAEGKVIGVATTQLETDSLQTNDQVEFLLTFYSKAEGDVSQQRFWVEGTRLDVAQ